MPSGQRRYKGLWARRRGALWEAPRPRERRPRSTRKRLLCVCLALATLAVWPAIGIARTYKVQKGDVLSSIAQRFLHGHVWGPHGTLQLLWNLNRDIKNPDYITPGEVIWLPDEMCVHAEPVPCPAQTPCPACAACPAAAPCPTCPMCPACPELAEPARDCNNRLPNLVEPDATDGHVQVQKPQENPNIQVAPAADTHHAPAPALLLGRKKRHLELHVSPYYRFTQLSAEVYADGSDANLDSKVNAGVVAGLSVDLINRLTLSVDVQAGTLYFASPSTVTLSTGAVFEYSAAVTLQFDVVPRLSLVGGFTYGNEPFSTADATLVLDIQMVSMPSAMAGLSLTALRFGNQAIGVDITAAYKFNVHTPQFQVRNGNVFFAGVFWRWLHNDRPRWRARLGFEQRRQDTSLISQTDNTVGLEASYVWPVD